MLITIEGIDGAGKSTQAEKAFVVLKDSFGRENVIWTREPGDWNGGNLLRELLLERELSHPLSELFLFLVDRCEHVLEVIVPAINEGKIVLCERYTDSTLAYQVWGRGLPLERIEDLFLWSQFPVPDLTLWLDVPLEEATQRINSRGRLDRIESDGLEFLSRVRDGYLHLRNRFPDRIRRVDASGSVNEVSCIIRQELKSFLKV